MFFKPLEQRPRILVADDDQAIRKLLCTIIGREGLDADCAADGREAIDLLEQHEYAVILLDLMMPRMSGFDVIDYLKEHPSLNKPVVLVVTAFADQTFKDVDSDIVAGVLRKPFEIADIGNLIRLCVRSSDDRGVEQLRASEDPSIRDLAARPPYDPDGEGASN